MASFFVNGKTVYAPHEKRLLSFLRNDLRITSVKDGCGEGACGTCTILLNGKAVKACTLSTEEIEGKNILTVEGLSSREKEIYTYAFGKAGAVQCGYCIPGMILCAKGLLDVNPNPEEREIRHAIRNNICRCTGYVKIVKAIQLAAKLLSEKTVPNENYTWKIGENVPRVDVYDKVTGRGRYVDDLHFENELEVVALRSEYPRAEILSIDTSEAEKINGVFVFTAKDIPGNKIVGHLNKDWDAMIGIGETTRFLGDVIALIAAPDLDTAQKAKELIKVEYRELPFVSNPYEAMKADAPLVHESGNLLSETHVNRGNVDKALSDSKYVLSERFSTPWTEHAFLETECAVAMPIEEGKIKIYSSDQSVYDTRRETAPMLGLAEDKVIVENCYVGGGFGGKEDVTVQHLAALAAMLTGRPCKMKLTRPESILVHPKRHPMDIEMTMGIDEKGIIQALKAKVIADTGAYASLGIPVLQRACTHACGPYNYQNFQIDGYAYYTNNPPAGAFRGFGVTQTCFAVESLLNKLADKAGIDHWEIRFRNAIRPGQVLPNGQIADESTGLEETLLAVKEQYYKNKYAGIACAMKNSGVGVGLLDYGRVKLEVKNSRIIIHCAGSCIGQGMCTILKQIVCDTTGLLPSQVIEEKANTRYAPDSGTTSGSRHTTVTGEAARQASEMLLEELKSSSLEELEGREFFAEYLAKTDPFGSTLPNPKSHIAYGFATQLCIINEESLKVEKIVAAHEVGKAINPINVEGQIEGGVVMGLGFALKEQYPLEKCRPLAKFGSLNLFRADEVPQIQSIIVEKQGLSIANGAIGIGEITSIPTAAAVADAYAKLDGCYRTKLPLSDTPYFSETKKTITRKAKCLAINTDARCIECLECVRTCAMTYNKTTIAAKACLNIKDSKPCVCIQCGKCASVCPTGAITKNSDGVWIIDKTKCSNCGKCRTVCPVNVMVANNDYTQKCISCGFCAAACPTGVLVLADKVR